jgi:hypothetical protein
MKTQKKTTRHWHIRKTPSGCVPVQQHFMHFWQSLSPEQKQEGRNAFLRVAYNRYLRTKDPAIARRLLAQIQGRKEKLIGGLGDYRPDSDFDPKQLKMGLKVEMEHTNDPKVAKEIVHDHLSEFPSGYYTELAKLEKKLTTQQRNDFADWMWKEFKIHIHHTKMSDADILKAIKDGVALKRGKK